MYRLVLCSLLRLELYTVVKEIIQLQYINEKCVLSFQHFNFCT
jgi:hypothetical protein